jgi:hypothetical protein
MDSNGVPEQFVDSITQHEPLLQQHDAANDQQNAEREAQQAHYEYETPARPWWRGNVTLYLGICYAIVLWCVFSCLYFSE